MKYLSVVQKSGFTLVEIMVVVSIIVVLSLAVLFSVADARKASRDLARESTAEQLKLAVGLYKEANGDYPDSSNPTKLIPTSGIGLSLMPYIKGYKDDPLSDATTYGYYYDSDFDCTQASQKVILVRTLEKHPGNITSVCGAGSEPAGWNGSTVFITVLN
jgi:prepilin-type N-terminal cleavage/methylation domain-containing protein